MNCVKSRTCLAHDPTKALLLTVMSVTSAQHMEPMAMQIEHSGCYTVAHQQQF